MASNILANLKVKHAPKQKKAFSIKIQQPMPQTQPLQSFQSNIPIPPESLSPKQILQPAKSIVQIPVQSEQPIKQPIKQSNLTSKIFNKTLASAKKNASDSIDVGFNKVLAITKGDSERYGNL